MPTKLAIVQSYIEGINGNYLSRSNTTNTCATTGCKKGARGAVLCARCYERLLAEHIGEIKAARMHNIVRQLHSLWDNIKADIEQEDIG